MALESRRSAPKTVSVFKRTRLQVIAVEIKQIENVINYAEYRCGRLPVVHRSGYLSAAASS